MVGDAGRRSRIVEEVEAIYAWLDQQLEQDPERSGRCAECGACCDFAAYDHRLYVTLPEIIYLTSKLGRERLKKMTSTRCPYQQERSCAIHEHRFSGCRIFCCKGDVVFQNDLSESVIARLKSLCERFNLPYRYMELSAALATDLSDIDLSVE